MLTSRPQGQFRQTLPSPNNVVCATKWCVFRKTEPTRAAVEAAVQERLDRTQSASVDLLQVRQPLTSVPEAVAPLTLPHLPVPLAGLRG